MKAFIKKIIVIVSIVLILLVGYGIDSIIASQYSIDFIDVTRLEETPSLDLDGNAVAKDIGISDGQCKVSVTVKVSKRDKAIGNHTLYVKTSRNIIGRYITNDKGIITFEYRCYLSSKPEDIIINIQDESNSIFVAVPATGSYTLKMIAPLTYNKDTMTTNDVFYDI